MIRDTQLLRLFLLLASPFPLEGDAWDPSSDDIPMSPSTRGFCVRVLLLRTFSHLPFRFLLIGPRICAPFAGGILPYPPPTILGTLRDLILGNVVYTTHGDIPLGVRDPVSPLIVMTLLPHPTYSLIHHGSL